MTPNTLDEQEYVTRWAHLDWFITMNGSVLHALAEPIPMPDEDEETIWTDALLLCGRRHTVFIPGVFSRMGAVRCRTCCTRSRYPAGVGSPKNDPAIRPLLGLPTTKETT